MKYKPKPTFKTYSKLTTQFSYTMMKFKVKLNQNWDHKHDESNSMDKPAKTIAEKKIHQLMIIIETENEMRTVRNWNCDNRKQIPEKSGTTVLPWALEGSVTAWTRERKCGFWKRGWTEIRVSLYFIVNLTMNLTYDTIRFGFFKNINKNIKRHCNKKILKNKKCHFYEYLDQKRK